MRVARVQIRVQIMVHPLKRKPPMSTTTIIIDEILDAGAKAMAEKWKPNIHGPLPLPEHLNVRVTHHLFNRMAYNGEVLPEAAPSSVATHVHPR